MCCMPAVKFAPTVVLPIGAMKVPRPQHATARAQPPGCNTAEEDRVRISSSLRRAFKGELRDSKFCPASANARRTGLSLKACSRPNQSSRQGSDVQTACEHNSSHNWSPHLSWNGLKVSGRSQLALLRICKLFLPLFHAGFEHRGGVFVDACATFQQCGYWSLLVHSSQTRSRYPMEQKSKEQRMRVSFALCKRPPTESTSFGLCNMLSSPMRHLNLSAQRAFNILQHSSDSLGSQDAPSSGK